MPARRVLPEQSGARPTPSADPPRPRPTCSRPCTPPSSCSAGPSRCCSSSRTSTGPTGPPASCCSFLFSRRFDAPGGDRGLLPQRRPAPPAPAAHRRRRVVPAARRQPGRARPAARRRRTRPGRGAAPRRRCPSARCAASSSGPRATRSSPRSWSAPTEARRRTRIPEALADLLLVRLDQLDDDARHVVRAAAVLRPPGAPRCCSTGSSTARSARSTWRCAPPSSATSWCRSAATATRSGTPCWPRPSTTTCCPASGCGCTRPTPRPCSRAGSAVRRPSWPGTPGRPTTCATAARASIAAGDEAMAVAGPDEAARHYELALELATDRPASTSIDAGRARRRRPCEAAARRRPDLPGPGAGPRPARGPPRPTRRRTPGCGCCGSRPRSHRRRHRGRPADEHHRGPRAAGEAPRRARSAAQVLALHARALAEERRRRTRRRGRQRGDGARPTGSAWPASSPTPAPRWPGCASAPARRPRPEGDPAGDDRAGPARPATWPPSCAACSTSAPCSTRAATSRRARESYARGRAPGPRGRPAVGAVRPGVPACSASRRPTWPATGTPRRRWPT